MELTIERLNGEKARVAVQDGNEPDIFFKDWKKLSSPAETKVR